MSHNDWSILLFAVALYANVIGLLLFVVFGEVTVRRLRKDPETRELLGLEFYSGQDICNVARAVSLPRKFARRSDHGPLALMRANSDAIYQHTSVSDRVLGRVFFWSILFAGFWTTVWLVVFSWR